jgi:cystine transport system substrate-binding protein
MKKLVLLVMALSVVVFGCAKKPQANVDSLTRIKNAGVIKIGIEGTYPPHTYHDANNNLVGNDVDIAREIAAKLGVKPEFIESSWDSLIAGVDTGRWDVVINQVAVKPERQEKYDFSIPYAYARGALIVRSDNDSIKSFEDLKGKKAAQTVTSNWADVARKYGAEIVGTVSGFNESIDLVINKRADATINDDVTYYDYKKVHADSPTKIAAFTDNVTNVAVLLGKNQPELLAAINEALQELRDSGKLSEIALKYFVSDISIPPQSE